MGGVAGSAITHEKYARLERLLRVLRSFLQRQDIEAILLW